MFFFFHLLVFLVLVPFSLFPLQMKAFASLIMAMTDPDTACAPNGFDRHDPISL